MNLLCALGLATCLCVNGHPASRPHATYAHLPTLACCERDHIIPLCLIGLAGDTLDNLQYQPWALAHQKDEREKLACERVCAGKSTVEEELPQFHREWGNNPATAPERKP